MFSVIKHSSRMFGLAFVLLLIGLAVRAAEVQPGGQVFLQRSTERLTTYAFREEEMRRLFEQVFSQRHGTWGRVSAFGEIPPGVERPALTEKNRLSALLHWESDLVCDAEEAGDYVFGSTRPEEPWAVFLNGQYCGGWQDSSPAADGIWRTAPARLSAGRHRLQFLAVQKNGSAPAVLQLQKKNGAELFEHRLRLQAVSEPSFVRLEDAPSEVRNFVSGWQINGRFHFLATGRYLDCYLKSEATPLKDGELFRRDAVGGEMKLPDGGELFVPGREGISLLWRSPAGDRIFPAAPGWPLAIPVFLRISLAETPLFLSARAPLRLRILQLWPAELPESLKKAWKLRCRQYDEAGTLQSDSIPEMDFQPELPLTLLPEPGIRRLSWQVEIGGIPASEAVELHIVTPDSFPENPSFCGSSLQIERRRAVLRCDLLRKRVTPAATRPPKSNETALKLYYFDEGLGDTHIDSQSPSGRRLPERLFQQLVHFSPGRVIIPEISGSRVDLQSVAAFAGLLNMRPDLAILNLGERELKAGRTPAEWCQQQLFFAQACLAAGIEPLLLAMPELPGIDPAVSRQSALLTKELGLALGVTVIDLYSQRILENKDTAAWYEDDFAQHRSVSRSGRRWLAEKVIEALQGSSSLAE